MTRSYAIGVVGFGVAGATAAYLLARDGHTVTLMERADRVGPAGAGIILQPSGQEVLRRLGLLDEVLAHAGPLDELHARHAHGGTLIRSRYADREPGSRAYGVHRGVIFRVLEKAVTTQSVEVRLACEIIGRTTSDAGVTLTDVCGNRHGPFDFVLATDGSRSGLRQACGFRSRVTAYNHGTLWAIAPATGVAGKLLQVVRGNRQLLGLLPLGDGLCTFYWGLPVRDYEPTRRRGLAALKQEVLKFCPESAEILEFLFDFDQLLFTTYRHVWMPRVFDAHTLFFGDAAHAMSPHLGQGMNLAMIDAYRFRDCLRKASSPLAAFQQFRRRQRSFLRYYQTVTFLLSPFFQSDWSPLGWGRDLVLPLLPKFPWVKQQMLLTVSGLKGGFLRGPITL